MVIACPIPLCGLSGATTKMSPSDDIAFTNDAIPFAEMLSSLVISMSGLSAIKFVPCKNANNWVNNNSALFQLINSCM